VTKPPVHRTTGAGRGGILVHAEHGETLRELLSPGRDLAAALGVPLAALVLGGSSRADARELIARGADEVVEVEDARLEAAHPEMHAAALEGVVRELEPGVALVGGTILGTEAAARVAQRLGAACATDCVALEARDGDLVVERVRLSRFAARQIFLTRPAIATVPPRRFDAPEPDAAREGSIRSLPADLPEARVRLLSSRPRERSRARIEKAERIVAVGRGLRSREDLEMIEALARALEAEVGASRPLTDDLQWLSPDLKVGLSGHTVRPALYVAAGISGQIEHNVGMRESEVVVAINLDPKAPILNETDYRVIGDLYQIVPAITRALQDAGDGVPDEERDPGDSGPRR
jgi:electron transfer flavoprotein alpha subunit